MGLEVICHLYLLEIVDIPHYYTLCLNMKCRICFAQLFLQFVIIVCLLGDDQTCLGVDWDDSSKTCWFHDIKSECQPLIQKDDVTHVRLTLQCGQHNLVNWYMC